MVDLIESLSHHAVNEGLERLSLRDWRPLGRRLVAQPRSDARRFGSVGDAVIQVLEHAGRELTIMEVHSEVQHLLQGRVAYSSVKNSLARRCRRGDAELERVGRGRYTLRDPGRFESVGSDLAG